MKKLRSERGASLLMALVLLLLASMVSAVILSAATSAAHRIRNDREAQQDYLTVSSAAEMIRDSIQADRYHRVVTITTYKDDGETVHDPNPVYDIVTQKPDGLLGAWLYAGIKDGSAVGEVSIIGCGDTIEIDVPVGGTESGETSALKTVVAEYSMEESSGNITVKLHLKQDGEGAGTGTDEDCRMTLTLKGKTTVSETGIEDTGEGVSVKKIETTITWGSGKIVKGIKEADSERAEK